MRLGDFDEVNQGRVITSPQTPYPWINYLGAEELFGLIFQQAGGHFFFSGEWWRRRYWNY